MNFTKFIIMINSVYWKLSVRDDNTCHQVYYRIQLCIGLLSVDSRCCGMAVHSAVSVTVSETSFAEQISVLFIAIAHIHPD